MTPLEFLSFRDRLEAGSGFQSDQFRRAGVRPRPQAIGARWSAIPRAASRARAAGAAARRPTLWDAFLRYLPPRATRCPRSRPRARRHACRSSRRPSCSDVLVDVYRHDPGLAELCERLVDLDEGLQEWRYRHVKMVRAHDRHKRGHRRLGRRGVPARPRSCGRCFPTCGRSAPSCEWPPSSSSCTLAQRARRRTTPASASPSGCCSPGTRTRPGPTAASRPSSGPGSTPRSSWTTSGTHAFAQAERVRAGFARLLGDRGRRHRARAEHPRAGGAVAVGAAAAHAAAAGHHRRRVPHHPPAARPPRRGGRRGGAGAARPVETLAERLAGGGGRPHRGVLVSTVFFDTAGIVGGPRRTWPRAARATARAAARRLPRAQRRAVRSPTTASSDAFVVGGGYKYCQLGEGNCFLRVPPGMPAAAGGDRLVHRVRPRWPSGSGAAAWPTADGGDALRRRHLRPDQPLPRGGGVRLLPRAGADARAAARGEPAPDRPCSPRAFDALDLDPAAVSRDRAVAARARSADFSPCARRTPASLCAGLREAGRARRLPRRRPAPRAGALPVRRAAQDAIGILGGIVRGSAR